MQAVRMGSLLQWNLTGGALLLLIGFTSALEGPKELAGFLGRPLSVVCRYSKGHEDYAKYWCQGDNWSTCTTVVKTDRTEAEVKAGRTFIKDNHKSLQFTVTLEKLTEEDAGTYWCAIERTGNDLKFHVTITVLPAPTTVAIIATSASTDPNVPIKTTDTSPGTHPASVATGNSNSPELNSEFFSSLDSSSIGYLMYVSFLILVGLKVPILLCLVIAMGWIYRKKRRSSHQVTSKTPSAEPKKTTL